MMSSSLTTLELLLLIVAAVGAQLAAGLVILVRQRRRVVQDSIATTLASLTPGGQAPVDGVEAVTAAWLGWRAFRVQRRVLEDTARSQCSFYFAPVDGLALPPYQPGQFLTVRVPLQSAQPGVAPTFLTRCYSLSDAPDPALYRITVKRALPNPGNPTVPAGKASGILHDQIREGETIWLRAPSGSFYLDKASNLPVVLIGGGIGITPMMSMLSWMVHHQPERRVHVYYGVRNSADEVFAHDLDALAAGHPQMVLHRVHSDPSPSSHSKHSQQAVAETALQPSNPAVHSHQGRITLSLLQQTLPPGSHQFYVCGPPGMMDTLVPALVTWGVPAHDLHYEAFGPATVTATTSQSVAAPQPQPAQRQAPLEIRFSRSERSVPWTGRQSNLLELAEYHHLQVDSGCRIGSCGACETRLVRGQVRYDQAPLYVPQQGHCLLCTAVPLSDLELAA